MKKSLFMASAASLVFVMSHTAHAFDGTITVQGKVNASTCTVDATTGTQTVVLPEVGKAKLAAVGDTTGRKAFHINLTGCTVATATTPAPVKQVSIAFEPGPNVNPVTGRLTNANTAADATKGIEVAILNDTYEHINLGAANSKSQFVDIDTAVGGTGTARLNFSAEYVAASTPVDVGNFNASVTYTLAYQ